MKIGCIHTISDNLGTFKPAETAEISSEAQGKVEI